MYNIEVEYCNVMFSYTPVYAISYIAANLVMVQSDLHRKCHLISTLLTKILPKIIVKK